METQHDKQMIRRVRTKGNVEYRRQRERERERDDICQLEHNTSSIAHETITAVTSRT